MRLVSNEDLERYKDKQTTMIKNILIISIVNALIITLAIGFVGIGVLNTAVPYSTIMWMTNAYFTVEGWSIFMGAQVLVSTLIGLISGLLISK
jgi:hypothetical protein